MPRHEVDVAWEGLYRDGLFSINCTCGRSFIDKADWKALQDLASHLACGTLDKMWDEYKNKHQGELSNGWD